MSSRESRAVVRGSAQKRSQSKERNPPSMSDITHLRIVLVGKSVSENSRVGNFVLGRAAFDSEAPPDVVERVVERLKDRHVTLINCPQLFQTYISDHQITQTVRECVFLSDPGPHVIVLLLNHEQCSTETQERVEKLLDSFSEQLFQHTMVLSTHDPTETNDILQKIIQKCSNRHFILQRSSSPDDLLQMFEDIVQMNDGRHLVCAQYEASQNLTMKQQATERFSESVKLNVVVCGSDGTLKSSVSELILHQTDRRADEELHGRLISLLELPALIRLSEEEVMRQTLRCVSLCHPGVHVFLLIIPDGSLNNEDKAEMQEIQRIFSSRINKHIMTLIMQNSEHQTAGLNEETQAVIECFGGRHHFFGPKTEVSTLTENIEKMLEENGGGFYSTETFLEAQMEKLLKYDKMKKRGHLVEAHLLPKVSREDTNELRIVLLGETGVGKSATGNTILGRNAFTAEASQESVTKESRRETSEINGRHVTVIDTPGLFDTELTNEEIQREISNCVSMILPGPHVFIIVLNLGQRFTVHKEMSVKIIQDTFGEKSLMFTMVLFTRGDDLKNKTIDQCLGKPGSPLMKLIEACGNRYHVFNNNQPEDRTQVTDLLQKIDDMLKENGGSYYSCKMFREMEREKQEEQMKILMDRVREREEEMKKLEEDMKTEQETFANEFQKIRQENEKLRSEKEKLQIKHGTITDRLMNQIENERKKREDEFKEMEERYKREMTEKEAFTEKMREEMKREREEREKQKQEEKTRREEEEEKRREKEQRVYSEFDEKLKQEKERNDEERKRREDEFKEREERYKREMKEKEEITEKMREEMKREREKQKQEKERMEIEKEDLQSKHEAEENKMKILMEKMNREREELMKKHEEEKERNEEERKRREDEFKEREERYKREMKEKEEITEKMCEEMKREREEREKQKQEEMTRREEEDEKGREKEQRIYSEFNEKLKQEKERMEREKEDLQSKHEAEENKMKILMEKMNREREELMKKHEEEKERNDEEGKAREHEFKEREERYKRLIKDREEKENKMLEQMKLERMQWEKQRLDERQKRDEKKKREQEKQQSSVSHLSPKEEPPKILKQNPLRRELPTDFDQHTPVSGLSSRRIVLLGKSGVGKSAVGNTILGQKQFRSVIRMKSVTRECSEAHCTVSGRSVSVVDTPPFFDTEMKPEELMMEIARSVYLSSPGPHALLIVLRVDERFTEVEKQIPQMIEMLFGEKVLKYSIILFTHGDDLGVPIEDVIKENDDLRDVVDQCGGRYQVFNNREMNNREQVNDLLQKIDTMIEMNGGGHYSNEMFKDAERCRLEEEQQRLREEEKRTQQEEEQRQKEIERVRKETEERTRAERYRDEEKSKPQQKESQQCVCS